MKNFYINIHFMNVRGIVAIVVTLLLILFSVEGISIHIVKANGRTLYVGGNGPNNYSKIQDAIDDALPGDTIFVYEGTYHENLIIKKSINLIGEDKNTTIIDGNKNGSVVYIYGGVIEITGFNITNGSKEWLKGGITITGSSYISIEGNIFYNNCIGVLVDKSHNIVVANNILINNLEEGVRLIDSQNNVIKRNKVINNKIGITISRSSNNRIFDNMISMNKKGMWIWYGSRNNEMARNIIYLNEIGICVSLSGENKIKENTFDENDLGIILHWSYYNTVINNNFFSNNKSAFFETSFLNIWLRNFWDRPRLMPKPIVGVIQFFPSPFFLIWLNFDFLPRFLPYEKKS